MTDSLTIERDEVISNGKHMYVLLRCSCFPSGFAMFCCDFLFFTGFCDVSLRSLSSPHSPLKCLVSTRCLVDGNCRYNTSKNMFFCCKAFVSFYLLFQKTYAQTLIVVDTFKIFSKFESKVVGFSDIFGCPGGFRKLQEACILGRISFNFRRKRSGGFRAMTKKQKNSRLLNSRLWKFERRNL